MAFIAANSYFVIYASSRQHRSIVGKHTVTPIEEALKLDTHASAIHYLIRPSSTVSDHHPSFLLIRDGEVRSRLAILVH